MLYLTYAMMLLHTFVGVILIAVILLQRGRGGGLAGAFGGMGGQSAFGTKAGDLFTRITIILATVWIALGGICVLMASSVRPSLGTFTNETPAIKRADEEVGTKEDTGKADEKKTDEEEPPVKEGEALPMPSDPPKTDEKTDGKPATKKDENKDEKTEATPAATTPVEEGKKVEKTDEVKAPEKPAEKPEEPATKPEKETPKESATEKSE